MLVRRLRLAFLTLLALAALPAAQQLAAQDAPYGFDEPLASGAVYRVEVSGMIDNGLARYLDRAIEEADEADAQALFVHMDTFGGLLDAADQIRQSFLEAPMPVVVYIDRNAISAGALIAYAADRILMVPGGLIGAATVVEGAGGEQAPDKYQSAMRAMMRATAEANDRDPRIAEAMVDETLEVEGISPEGQVLTLSAEEAVRFGVAEALAETEEEALALVGLSSEGEVFHSATRLERALRFFGSPVVQSILMLMMMGGLYFELQSPGVGFAGGMAAIGAALFFAPNYMLGLVESWEIVLFGLGVVLIIVEIFVIPGFGVAGILGAILMLFSLGTALIGNVGFDFPSGGAITQALATLASSLVLSVMLIASLGRYLPKTGPVSRLVLAGDLGSDEGYTSADTDDTLVGQVGVALTTLRPSGTAEIGERRVDVVSAGDFIEAGAAIEVVSARGSRVEVRRVRDAAPGGTGATFAPPPVDAA
jgi:membrane-bound serine protease (ClpP class)